MRMSELIEKKRDGEELSGEEIRWMIEGYTNGSIPDYQMSAMCMAIYFKRMNDRETYDLTMAMLNSGDTVDLSGVTGVKADKHSTGGVGDKTSIVLCPMLAACGVKMAKLSGRGLGHTGGTIDKLESFAGFSTSMTEERFIRNVNENGFAIAGQTGKLVPADKKLYALRDVTATVDSRALIVSSIMSKKLASGADVIVLDVKTGSGAFMTTETRAFGLARALTEVGRRAGKKVVAVVSDMNEPLGHAVGNALEVREAIAALKGEYSGDLMELCYTLGSQILLESGLAESERQARAMLQKTIDDGSAFRRFRDFIASQGGSTAEADDPSLLPQAKIEYFKDAVSAYTAVSQGKLDAFVYGKRTMETAIKNGMKAKAYDAARKTVECGGEYVGKAYYLIGNMWIGTACQGNEIERRAPYWVATDYFQKAKNADASLADDCNRMISQASAYYPQAAEAFMYDLSAGQSYTVSCGGLSATTTVRVNR